MLTLNFTPFPTLVTERLVLRRVTRADAPEMFFMRSNPEMMEFIKREPCRSLEEAATFIDDKLEAIINGNEGLSWGITLKGEDKIIGTGGPWRFMKDHYRAELGYALMPQYQSKGIMHEALTAMIHHSFHTIGLHTIEANIDPGNIASQRVLEKLGFTREGYQRQNYFYEGKFYDTGCYALISPLA